MADTIKEVLQSVYEYGVETSGDYISGSSMSIEKALAEIKRIIEEAKPELYIETKHYGISLHTHNPKKLSKSQIGILEQYYNNLLKVLGISGD